jgi:SAM-dependent methyltransferase
LSDKTVVEFYYNNDPDVLDKFKWVPLRTRYDKTESVIRFGRKYGNYVTVAQKVWRSIVNPVLMSDFDDLAKGNNPEKNNYWYDKKIEKLRKTIGHELIISATKENAYFQKRTDLAKPMRNFHNWIKSNIIYTFCHPMYQDNKQLSVLDVACGRGGDIMKFYYSMSAFYVGIDIDREGLVSAVDGAQSRYNQLRTKRPNFPKMYFIQGDATAQFDLESQKNALNVKRLENEDFFKKFFSNDPKERTLFDIINCQFAIHYMLRNNDTWTNFKTNINNYLRNGGMFLATTFDAEKITKLLGNNDNYIQEYTDENGKAQTLFEIRKKYDNPDKNTIIGTGNPIDVYISWFSQEGRFLTEYLVDSRYIVQNLKDECNLDLIDTDNFENQLMMHEPYLNTYAKYEEVDETRKFLGNVAEFYRNNSVNDGCKIWNGLFRYYVFRKQSVNKKQKGGNSEDGNMIDFSDSTKFNVPSMSGYDNEYSCINSIHHILKSHKIIPKSISPDKMCSDLGISLIKDNDIEVNSSLSKIAKSIVIEHVVDFDDKKKDKEVEKVLDGLNVFIVERDCNDVYDVDLIKKSKKVSKDDTAVILMKEGTWYIPVYYVNPQTQKRTGLYEMSHSVIQKMMDEL